MDQLPNETNGTNSTGAVSIDGLSAFSITWQTLYAICTFVPNLLVLFAFLFKINERSYSNMCFISLTFCDLLVGMVALPMNTLTNEITMNFYLGIVVMMTTYALPTIGLYTLILLGCHRLKQLLRPTCSTEKMNRIRAVLLLGCWVFTFSAWIVIVAFMVKYGHYKEEFADMRPPPYVIIILDVFSYFLPMMVIFVTTTTTIFLLIKKRKKFTKNNSIRIVSTNYSNGEGSSTNQNDQSSQKKGSLAERFSLGKHKRPKLSRDQKAILCLLTIIITNFLSQILYVIFWPLKHYNQDLFGDVYFVANWVGYANSLMNPFILLAFNETIRKAVISLFVCSKRS